MKWSEPVKSGKQEMTERRKEGNYRGRSLGHQEREGRKAGWEGGSKEAKQTGIRKT